MIALEIKKSDNRFYRPVAYWRESLPFAKNARALLIHRPRRITTHKLSKSDTHIAVKYHCGNTQCGDDNFTFLKAPEANDVVCARCEALAVKRGFPASSAIAKTHVHVGGLKAVRHCCNEEGESK